MYKISFTSDSGALTSYKSFDIHWINQKQGWSGFDGSTTGGPLSVSFSMKGIELIINTGLPISTTYMSPCINFNIILKYY